MINVHDNTIFVKIAENLEGPLRFFDTQVFSIEQEFVAHALFLLMHHDIGSFYNLMRQVGR